MRSDGYRIHWWCLGAPYRAELALRHRGVQCSGWRCSWFLGKSQMRHVSVVIPRGQKSWAEEILFVQLGQVPYDTRELSPATVRRMATREQYVPASKWQKGARRRITLHDFWTDFLGVVAYGYAIWRDPDGVQKLRQDRRDRRDRVR